jgi:hypothetical protein
MTNRLLSAVLCLFSLLTGCSHATSPLLPGVASPNAAARGPAGASAVVWVATDAIKVRPFDKAQLHSNAANLGGARGETVAFQVVVNAIASLANVMPAVSDLSTNVYQFGDNGDGMLFYPGKVSLIGGRHDIPCPSIRLKEVRAAMQDYEYMVLLHQKGQDAFLNALVRKMVQKTNVWTQSGADLDNARAAMATKILSS